MLSFWKITEFIFKHTEIFKVIVATVKGKLLDWMDHRPKEVLHFLIFSHKQYDLAWN